MTASWGIWDNCPNASLGASISGEHMDIGAVVSLPTDARLKSTQNKTVEMGPSIILLVNMHHIVFLLLALPFSYVPMSKMKVM